MTSPRCREVRHYDGTRAWLDSGANARIWLGIHFPRRQEDARAEVGRAGRGSSTAGSHSGG